MKFMKAWESASQISETYQAQGFRELLYVEPDCLHSKCYYECLFWSNITSHLYRFNVTGGTR